MSLLSRTRGVVLAVAVVLGALFVAAGPAQAAVHPNSQTFNVHGVSCTLHSETNGLYNSMFCSTSSNYHFTSTDCRTSCTTLGSNTLANNRLVHICGIANAGLSNTLTIYFGSTNEGSYTVARNSIPPIPC